jgi:hypothetical protein
VVVDSGTVEPDLLDALRILVDPTRVRVLGRLLAHPADAATIAAELRQTVPAATRQLEALRRLGFVERREDPGSGAGTRYVARPDRLGELARALAGVEADGAPPPAGPAGGWPHEGEPLAATLERLALAPEEAKVLRSFVVDGRLTTIPASGRKREVVLRFLLERVFAEDRDYAEKEVNQRLALFHPDVASLRRYLVDGGYVDRAAGVYRRRPPVAAPPA